MTELNAETNNCAVNGAATHEMNGEAEVLHFPSLETDAAAAPSQVKRPARHATQATGAPQSVKTRDLRVADIRKDQQDTRGEKIDFVFYRRREFAIYRSGGRIMVQYADHEAVAKDQVTNIADLLKLRDDLQNLVADMSNPDRQQSCEWQIADSLRLGLYGQKDAAKKIMQTAIEHITETRVRRGRIAYLRYTWKLVAVVLALLIPGAAACRLINYFRPETLPAGLDQLMMATASGAIGALFFTANALRDRSVATDGDSVSNALDSSLRILIGVISAAVLYLILASNLFSNISVGGMALGANAVIWQSVLLIGFVAGFLQRLVPDLLEKKLAPVAK